MTDPGPIFLVGSGRSGTTLLQMVLSAHPRIHLTHELSFYAWEALFDRRASGAAFLDYFLRTLSFRWTRLDPGEVRARLQPVPERASVHRIFSVVMQLAAEREGKVRFGDKTPGHSGRLEPIFRDFPQARVIHMIRDPRGTLRSLSRMPWASGSDVANALLYEHDRRAAEPFLDRILRVRLESLLEDPERCLREILDYLEEPWDPAVLDHAAHSPRFDALPPFPWLASSGRPIEQPAAPWRDLPAARIRRIETLCRKSMAAYGYEPAELDRKAGAIGIWPFVLSQVPEVLRFAWVLARLALLLRRPEGLENPRRKRLYQRLNPGAWRHYPGFSMPPPPPPMKGRSERLG